jgi:hypothetical protein
MGGFAKMSAIPETPVPAVERYLAPVPVLHSGISMNTYKA